ncbi:MAG TPA: ATP-binding protein [Streptosporangiaceae bacterium]|nr:ATP-binding protein [Streptosporangiaceae bacterium]
MAAITPAVSRGGSAARRGALAAGAGGPASPAHTTPVTAGSLTLPGQTRNVAEARAFVAKTLGPGHPCCDAAVLLCSELVANAILHTASGRPGGTVTVVVLRLTGAVRVEVIDHGSASSTPVVKGAVLAPDGHGLFLVDQLASSWGYVRDRVGTTVWFRLTC